ncbi:MAG: hypothetical protein LBV66_02625, partial [Elusimicrobiota bacterium]|nr:hypothetical protein [Elusimicrobiota bacterium]
REALDELSGAFYTDLLALNANNSDAEIVYEKIGLPDVEDKENKEWVEVGFGGISYGANDNGLKDFSVKGAKIYAGGILSKTQSSVNGVYGSYGVNRAEQGMKKAGFSDVEVGLYKGIYMGEITIKGNFAIGLQSYEVERKMTLAIDETVKSDFMTYGVKAGGEVQYLIWTTEAALPTDAVVEMKMFGGLHGGFSKNEEIKESGDVGLKIESGYYMRLMALFGVRADGKIKGILWYGKLFVGGIDLLENASYDMTMLGEKMSDIEGTKEKAVYAGLAGGFEYQLGSRTKLTIDTTIKSGADMFEYYGGAGVKFSF